MYGRRTADCCPWICPVTFILFMMQELRKTFETEAVTTGLNRLLVSAAIPAIKQNIDDGYDGNLIGRYVCLVVLALDSVTNIRLVLTKRINNCVFCYVRVVKYSYHKYNIR